MQLIYYIFDSFMTFLIALIFVHINFGLHDWILWRLS